MTTNSELVAMLAVYRGHYISRTEYMHTDRVWEFEIEATAEEMAAIDRDLKDPDAGVYLLNFAAAMKCVYSRKAEVRRQFNGRQSRW